MKPERKIPLQHMPKQNGGNAVIHLSDSRLLVTDIDGNRYEIPDFYQLSVVERKKLDLFI